MTNTTTMTTRPARRVSDVLLAALALAGVTMAPTTNSHL